MKVYNLLAWDTDFFGFRIFKLEISDYNVQEIKKSVNSAFDAGAELIYLIIPENIDNKEIFQTELIDRKVIFSKNIKSFEFQIPEIVEFGEYTIPKKLYDIALESGKYSRFKLDSRLPLGSYEKLYKKWIEKSVSGEIADKVFVYKEYGEILGLITLKIKTDHGEIGLLAADYSAQGKGIGSKLISAAEDCVVSRHLSIMEVATQLKNEDACRFYEKNGYLIKEVLNYYHIWKN